MKAIEIGSLDSWTSKNDVQHIPYEKSFAEAEWTPLVVLHTSGSTGLPKPIEVPQGMFATCDGTHNVPNWNGRRYWFRFREEVSVKHFIPSKFPGAHAREAPIGVNLPAGKRLTDLQCPFSTPPLYTYSSILSYTGGLPWPSA